MAKSKNIWQDKKLVPLEYCSIVRAAKLLECDVEDIIQWIELGAIHTFGKFKGEKSKIGFRVENIDIYNDLNLSGAMYETRIINGHSLFVAEENPSPDSNNRVHSDGKIYGYWKINQWSFGSLEFNTIVYPVIRAENCRHFHVKLFDELSLEVDSIYISKNDIEKLYSCSQLGEPIPSSKSPFFDKPNSDDSAIRGSRYIDLLNVVLGTHPDFGEEIFSMSNNALTNKISSYASKFLRNSQHVSPNLIEAMEKCAKLDRKTLAKFRGSAE